MVVLGLDLVSEGITTLTSLDVAVETFGAVFDCVFFTTTAGPIFGLEVAVLLDTAAPVPFATGTGGSTPLSIDGLVGNGVEEGVDDDGTVGLILVATSVPVDLLALEILDLFVFGSG